MAIRADIQAAIAADEKGLHFIQMDMKTLEIWHYGFPQAPKAGFGIAIAKTEKIGKGKEKYVPICKPTQSMSMLSDNILRLLSPKISKEDLIKRFKFSNSLVKMFGEDYEKFAD